jgi:nitroimidazol reductase NimA-like FMN-containing flavoprotein (pyridoxamine 5'-phosphate oxidase superfamily)
MIELGRGKCEKLLASHSVGRVAIHDHEGLAIFPVNYRFEGGRVAIRCDEGSRLHRAAQSSVVFEIDDTAESLRTGWSVVVWGTAYEVTGSLDQESIDLRDRPVDTWAPGHKGCWIRIEPQQITGRLVRPG